MQEIEKNTTDREIMGSEENEENEENEKNKWQEKYSHNCSRI